MDRMIDSGDEIPAPTTHFYSAETPRSELTVYCGPLIGRRGARQFDATGSISLRWNPWPMLQWSAGSEEVDVGIDLTTGSIVLDDPQMEVPKMHTFQTSSSEHAPTDDFQWEGHGPQSQTVVGDPDASYLTHATFILANLPAMTVGGRLRHETAWYMGRTVLTGAGWKVTLDSPWNRREIEEDLHDNGGHAVTHTCRVEKEDGSDFDAESLLDVLGVLRYALSLAFGRWISPILPVAYNASAEPAWSRWASPLVSPWRASPGVVDSLHPEQLQELFDRLAVAWTDPLKQEVVRRAVYYLIDANDPHALELAVSSAQSGLELLAWSELVEDRQAYTAGAYKKLKAHESIRKLLALHSISSAFPPELSELALASAKLTDLDVGDGPEVLTRMRNGVQHPSRKKPKFGIGEWYDAWCLARHYLQLAILAYIGYQGTQCDPAVKEHHTGQSEEVPWNRSTNATGSQ